MIAKASERMFFCASLPVPNFEESLVDKISNEGIPIKDLCGVTIMLRSRTDTQLIPHTVEKILSALATNGYLKSDRIRQLITQSVPSYDETVDVFLFSMDE